MKSFVLYSDWKSIFQLLPTDEERTELLYMIFDYMNGEPLPDCSDSVRIAWEFMEPKLKENRNKYDKKVERIRNVNDTKSSRNRDEVVNDNETKSSRNHNDNVGVTDTVTVTVTDTVLDNTRKLVLSNGKENSKEKRFVKPTLDEIQLYILDNDLNVDAETFFDFYESKSWKVGKSPMKDWRAALRNWNRRNTRTNNGDFIAAFEKGEI